MDQQRLQEQRWASLGRLLGFSWMAFHSRVVAKVKKKGFHDLGEPHFKLTRSMDYAGTGITELARRAGVTKQAMSSLVRSMESMGYLEKIPDPADGRAVLVRYTRRGMRLAKALVQSAEQVENELREAVGDSAIDDVYACLGKMLDTILPEHDSGWPAKPE